MFCSAQVVIDIEKHGITFDVLSMPIWMYDSTACSNIWGNRWVLGDVARSVQVSAAQHARLLMCEILAMTTIAFPCFSSIYWSEPI